jgi:hypothetical protein
VIEVAEKDDVRAHLNALTLLVFVVDPGSENYARAQHVNELLGPARDVAREALRAEPREGPATAAGCAAPRQAWELVDRAGAVIDREPGWWLDPEDSTRAWVERRVAGLIEARAQRAR